MRHFFFPIQDTTIYEQYPYQNTGLDEILEIGKSSFGTRKVRSLISFELPTDVPLDAEYEIKLYTAHAEKLDREQTIRCVAQSQDWTEGDGYYYQDIMKSKIGATWTDAMSGSLWSVPGAINGGLSVSGTLHITPDHRDFTLNVTSIVRSFISASQQPSMVLAYPDVDEIDDKVASAVKFFSKDTHTIYSPVLVAKWDDQTISTGSLTPFTSVELHIQPRSLKPSYTQGETATVYLNVRNKYPQKTFSTVMNQYSGLNYLPDTSYFSIVDELSNTTIIPFDEYSKISADDNGCFVLFRTDAMYARRYYRILFKVVRTDGRVEVIDDNYIFTVTQ